MNLHKIKPICSADLRVLAREFSASNITELEVRKKLHEILCIEYKPRLTGKARVKDTSRLIYAGETFDIIDLYMTHEKSKVYPNGAREFVISLSGTKFEKNLGYSHTTITENDLEIIELNEL